MCILLLKVVVCELWLLITYVEGCQGAVLRIYRSDVYTVDYEACGQEAPVDNVISENGFIRIKYVCEVDYW